MNFSKYGSFILPFYNIHEDIKGGKWEYCSHDVFAPIKSQKFENIDWCRSYQQIKHNYIDSIKEHGNIKNAIMTLAAFYMLLIYKTCLPFKQFDFDNKTINYEIDFGSKIFTCDMCNFLRPTFITNSEYEKCIRKMKLSQEMSPLKDAYKEQDILDGYESCMFLITLNHEKYLTVKELVNSYCAKKNLESFDVAPYEDENSGDVDSEGFVLYEKISKITKIPYFTKDVKITFNLGLENIYESFNLFDVDYEKLKYSNRNKTVLSNLKIGDNVNIKLSFNDKFENCTVKDLTENVITLNVIQNQKVHQYSAPISNIIYIKKKKTP